MARLHFHVGRSANAVYLPWMVSRLQRSVHEEEQEEDQEVHIAHLGDRNHE